MTRITRRQMQAIRAIYTPDTEENWADKEAEWLGLEVTAELSMPVVVDYQMAMGQVGA